jgi:hypothetical protein
MGCGAVSSKRKGRERRGEEIEKPLACIKKLDMN